MSTTYRFINIDKKAEAEKFNDFLETQKARLESEFDIYAQENTDLAEMIDDRTDQIINNKIFWHIDYAEDATVIGTTHSNKFSWGNDIGSVGAVRKFMADNDKFIIEDEYGTAITVDDMIKIIESREIDRV